METEEQPIAEMRSIQFQKQGERELLKAGRILPEQCQYLSSEEIVRALLEVLQFFALRQNFYCQGNFSRYNRGRAASSTCSIKRCLYHVATSCFSLSLRPATVDHRQQRVFLIMTGKPVVPNVDHRRQAASLIVPCCCCDPLPLTIDGSGSF